MELVFIHIYFVITNKKKKNPLIRGKKKKERKGRFGVNSYDFIHTMSLQVYIQNIYLMYLEKKKNENIKGI